MFHKKRRRLLPFIPAKDAAQRLLQMRSLAAALTAMNMEFSAELTYMPGMAPRSTNQAKCENGGMQVYLKYLLSTNLVKVLKCSKAFNDYCLKCLFWVI